MNKFKNLRFIVPTEIGCFKQELPRNVKYYIFRMNFKQGFYKGLLSKPENFINDGICQMSVFVNNRTNICQEFESC